MNVRLRPETQLTKAELKAAEDYSRILTRQAMHRLVPHFVSLLIMAMADCSYKEKSIQRVYERYCQLMSEYAGDFSADPKYMEQKLQDGLKQRRITIGGINDERST